MATNISVEICTANLPYGVSNLLALYARASTADIASGKVWYQLAHDDAQRISALYSVPFDTVVKVACALSPRLSWENNMPAAESVIRHYVTGGYVPSITPYANFVYDRPGEKMVLQRTRHSMDDVVIADDPRLPTIAGPTKVNVCKALWILQGHTWVLRGSKVNSFCDNIAHYDTSMEVTVDSHYIQCWRGIMEEGTYSVPESFYAIIVADTLKVAAMLGITPLQLQAILWIAKKRITKLAKRAAAQAKKTAAKKDLYQQSLDVDIVAAKAKRYRGEQLTDAEFTALWNDGIR